MRRHFQLSETDTLFLDSLGLVWETINDQGMNWIILYDFPVIQGYNLDKVSVAIKLETGYPRSPLDMVYFYPSLNRLDGKIINAVTPQLIDGLQFQRWSRHRTPQNPWREGIDDISTHLSLITFWLEQELTKHANVIAA